VDKTTAGQKGSGGLQDVELKRRVGGIYGGGGGGGREKKREGKEDDDRLKHFGRLKDWNTPANLDILKPCPVALHLTPPFHIDITTALMPNPGHNQSCSS
jgi:hypothetical protein